MTGALPSDGPWPDRDLGAGLLRAVLLAVRPLAGLALPERAEELLRALGWDPEPLGVTDAVVALGTGVSQAVRVLEPSTDLGATPSFDDVAGAVAAAAPAIAEFTRAVREGPLADTVGDELLADLLVTPALLELGTRFPRTVLPLRMLGVLAERPVEAITGPTGAALRQAGSRTELDLGAVERALAGPLAALRAQLVDAADGSPRPPAAVIEAIAEAVRDPLMASGATTRFPMPPGELPAALAGLPGSERMLRITLRTADAQGGTVAVTVHAGVTDDPVDGTSLLLAVDGTLTAAVGTGAGRLDVELGAGGVPLLVTRAGVRVLGATGSPPRVGLGFATAGPPPAFRLGDPAGTRIEVGSVTAAVSAALSDGAAADVVVDVALGAVRVAAGAPGGDGFLAAVLGGVRVESVADLGLRWSLAGGLQVRGGGGLVVELPLDTQLGPLTITSARAGLAFGAALSAELSAGFALNLGPFRASVDRLGMTARFVPSGPGAPGGAAVGALELALKPPSGIGLVIRTPAVSGGGYLELNPDEHRYAGVAELTLLGTVSVKVVGILTTRLPDGSPGFALLLMITAEGFTPIQLGLGFVLTGIGGLLALNRTIDVDAVRGGLRSGVLDSVLFPRNPVENAPRLIATLDRLFPQAPDRLLVGPLVEIGWGSPPVVKARIALLLELPQPLRVMLLAALSLALPDEDAPVVEIHVDAIGVLDLSRGELALDASLHHSRLWTLTLSGELALRLNWGSDPRFLLSIGGFHPRAARPPGLRDLDRLAVGLALGAAVTARLELYLALTTNTIQMGARLHLRAEFGGFGIEGGGAFDALVQWVPFHLDVALEAWVRVFTPLGTLLGIRLALQVTGPQPWHIVGTAELQILFWTVRAGVDLTIGEPQEPPALDTVDVATLIRDELARPGSWTALPPAGVAPAVTLAAGDVDRLVVDPLATVSGRQKVAPLATRVSRVGALLPRGGAREYHLDATVPESLTARTVDELFPQAQFTEMANADERLRAPAVTAMPGGIEVAGTAASVPLDLVARTDLAAETIELVSLDEPGRPV